MKKIRFLTLAILLLTSLHAFTQSSPQRADKDEACLKYKKEAEESIKSGTVIYKRFGMPVYLLSQKTLAYLHENYQLEIKQMGCLINPGDTCYNKEIDDYLLKKHGKRAYELIAEAEEKTKFYKQ